MPSLDGAAAWINSPPLTRESLRGKVVLIDFWTYSCINCLRTVPYVRAWAERYRKDGLEVIGVHSPEFAFEKDLGNVRKAVRDLNITYPVAVDNDRTIWRAFENHYWPAHYFIDARGRIRYFHFGEGGYAESERVIQRLLAEVSPDKSFAGAVAVTVNGEGVEEAASGDDDLRSPETYIGFGRTKGSVSQPAQRGNRSIEYTASPAALGQWGLAGQWTVTQEYGRADKPGARILYRFRARDVHLVLGPSPDGRPIRFRVTIDGKPPGPAHGLDIDAAGNGTVTEQRLYQLVRFARLGETHDFAIEFLDPGVEAFSFTFG
jgi:thiol-disulfide isomerase/thioredoxin